MNINIPKNVKFIIDTYYNNNYETEGFSLPDLQEKYI